MTKRRYTRPEADWRFKQQRERERKKLEAHPELAVCWLCGNPIDMNLPPLHTNAFTLDHIIPLARGGDLHGETKPAHRSCNSARGKGNRNGKKPETLIDW